MYLKCTLHGARILKFNEAKTESMLQETKNTNIAHTLASRKCLDYLEVQIEIVIYTDLTASNLDSTMFNRTKFIKDLFKLLNCCIKWQVPYVYGVAFGY